MHYELGDHASEMPLRGDTEKTSVILIYNE